MKKKTFSVDYLTPDSRKVSFPSGEEVIVKHVFELKDYIVIGDDTLFFVLKKDCFFVLLSIEINNRYFDEEYDRRQNTISFNHHGASHFATLNFDTMDFDIRKKDSDEKKVKIVKNTDNHFFCVFEDVAQKAFYLQFGTAGKAYPHFLRVRNYVIFGDQRIYVIRNMENNEKYSLLVEENMRVSGIEPWQKDTGCFVFVQKNGEESVYDAISKKIVSGAKVVKTL